MVAFFRGQVNYLKFYIYPYLTNNHTFHSYGLRNHQFWHLKLTKVLSLQFRPSLKFAALWWNKCHQILSEVSQLFSKESEVKSSSYDNFFWYQMFCSINLTSTCMSQSSWVSFVKWYHMFFCICLYFFDNFSKFSQHF